MFLIVKLITPVCISKKLHSVQIYIFDSIGMPGYTDLYRIVSNCMKLKYYIVCTCIGRFAHLYENAL